VPSTESASVEGTEAERRWIDNVCLPIVVPAKATHADIYQASVRGAAIFLAPRSAAVAIPTRRDVGAFRIMGFASQYDSKVVEPDDKATEIFCPNGGKMPKRPKRDTFSYYSSYSSGPASIQYGVPFDKAAVEIRQFYLRYDANEYRAMPNLVSSHGSLLTVPGPGWKPPAVTLEKCIADSAMPQDLTGTDQFYCPACKQHQDARKTETVMRLPPLLCVHLKRFSLNWETGATSKNNTPVPYPELLDVASCVSNTAKASGVSTKYRLFGSVHHSGSLSFGHYTAVVAGEKPVDDPDAAKEAAEAAEKKKKEEEEKKKKEEEEAAKAKADSAVAGADAASSSSSAAAAAAVPKKIHFKDADILIARLHAKIAADAEAKKKKEEAEAAAKLQAAETAGAAAGGGAAAAAEAEAEAARKKKAEEEAAEAAAAEAERKKKKKKQMQRVWLDANDSWVTELDAGKAMNPSTVYVMFYERIDEPANGAAADDDG
jgi:hypothetical protein